MLFIRKKDLVVVTLVVPFNAIVSVIGAKFASNPSIITARVVSSVAEELTRTNGAAEDGGVYKPPDCV
jgi:hypothetical protein